MDGQFGTGVEQDMTRGRGVYMTRRLGVGVMIAVVAIVSVFLGTSDANAAIRSTKVMHPCDIDGDQQISGTLGKLCRQVWRQAAFSYRTGGKAVSHGSGPNTVTKIRKKMDAEDWGPIQFGDALRDVRAKFNKRENPTSWQAVAFDDPNDTGLHPADTDDADMLLSTDTEILAGKVWKQPQFQLPKKGGGESRFGSGPWAVTNASDAWGRGAISESQYIAYLKKYRTAYLKYTG